MLTMWERSESVQAMSVTLQPASLLQLSEFNRVDAQLLGVARCDIPPLMGGDLEEAFKRCHV